MTHQSSSSSRASGHGGVSTALFGGFVLIGTAVSLALGVYSKTHGPTGRSIVTFGFPTLIDMKVWLTTAALVFAFVQLVTALRIYGRFGHGDCPPAVTMTHRISGVIAVVLTLPVAFHCVWSLGFNSYSDRVLAHSLLGCAFYGAFVTKMLVVKSSRMPNWALPLLGGIVFVLLVCLWLTSSLWFFSNNGLTYGVNS